MEKIEYSGNPYLLEENYKGLVFKLKKSKYEVKDQYVTEIFINNSNIGYLYFNRNIESIEFIGIFINPNNRNLGISKIIFEYFNILCSGYYNSSKITTVQQKKPLTSSILVKDGYLPIKRLIEGKRLYVGKVLGDNDNLTGIFPESDGIAQKISQSMIRGQKIKVVDDLNQLINPTIIGYNKKYKKILNQF